MKTPTLRILPLTIVVTATLLGSKSLELAWAAVPSAAATVAAPIPVAGPVKADTGAPKPMSDAERTLLLDLRARREQLDQREKALETREAVLTAAEKKMTERLSQLQDLQKQLESVSTQRAKQEEAAWSNLVALYEAMKPRDAANIFNDLDMPVLVELTARMNERKAASIMAAMQPDRARDLTTRLAEQRVKTSGGT